MCRWRRGAGFSITAHLLAVLAALLAADADDVPEQRPHSRRTGNGRGVPRRPGRGKGRPVRVPGPFFLDSDFVVELTPERFKAEVQRGTTPWLVDLYADWCGHCREFAVFWNRVGKELKAHKCVSVGALDCAKYPRECGDAGVRSYPKIHAYHFPTMGKDSYSLTGADIPRQGNTEETIMNIIMNHVLKLPKCENTAPSVFVQHQRRPVPKSRMSTEKPWIAATGEKSSEAIAVQGRPQVTHSPTSGTTLAIRVNHMQGRLRGTHASTSSTTLAMRVNHMHDIVRPSLTGGFQPEHTGDLRLFDAEVALLASLYEGAFLAAVPAVASGSDTDGSNTIGPHVLAGDVLAELISWLEFLAVVFPSRRARESLAAHARFAGAARYGASHALDRDKWVEELCRKAIDRVPPEAAEESVAYWRLCATFTCGLWTLFHVITVSVAEAHDRRSNGGSWSFPAALGGNSGPSPSDALLRIRNFIQHFFGCDYCRTHFLETFDSCAFDRCDLAPDDGPGSALWLWRVHNLVRERTAIERGELAPPPWPERSECAACWLPPASRPDAAGGGAETWNATTVYAHLRHSFLPPELLVADMLFYDAEAQSVDTSIVVIFGGVFSTVLVGFFARRRLRRLCHWRRCEKDR